jgi:hypothetical protein
MRRTHFPVCRYWIIDHTGSNKIVYWYSDVLKWLSEYGLEEIVDKRNTKYSSEYTTTFIYVKPLETN